ncbi:MAG: endonuclease/exonuclease/phosphatase family protein, partial [Bacteroidota bacterium]
VTRILEARSTQFLLLTLFILGAILCVFTPNYFLFKWGESFAMYIMFGYLLGGLVFLFFSKPKMMFTSFACCAGLALYLKDASNGNLVYPARTSAPAVSVANFNLSASNENFIGTTEAILKEGADVVSVQEIDPNWQSILDDALKVEYPYSAVVFRPENFQGIGIYSRTPLTVVDTFYFEDVPNLKFKIEMAEQEVCLMSAYIYPEFNTEDYARKQQHLDALCHNLEWEEVPFITMGDFNEVQWSGYIRDFRRTCQLSDSRRFPTWVKRPTDHIFYSRHFECVAFKSITTNNTTHLGISGTYQFHTPLIDVETAAQ